MYNSFPKFQFDPDTEGYFGKQLYCQHRRPKLMFGEREELFIYLFVPLLVVNLNIPGLI